MNKKNRSRIQTAINSLVNGKGSAKLIKVLPLLIDELVKSSFEEQDFRPGKEVYGYDDVRGTMEYIQDRWMCAHRIRWIVDGLVLGEI